MSVRSSTEGTLLQRVAAAVQGIEPGAHIILYGSRARGDAGSDSDWDFLVLLDGPVDRRRMERVRDAVFDVELSLDGCPVLSTIIRGKDEWETPRYQAMPFRQNVEREGIVL